MTVKNATLPLPKTKTEGRTQDHQHWGHLQGSSHALAIATAFENSQGPVVLLTADTPSALKLQREIAFFSAFWREAHHAVPRLGNIAL